MTLSASLLEILTSATSATPSSVGASEGGPPFLHSPLSEKKKSAWYMLHFRFGIDRLGFVSVLPLAFPFARFCFRMCFGLALRKYRCSVLVFRRFRWLLESRSRSFCPFCFCSHSRQQVFALNHLLQTRLGLFQHLLFALSPNTTVHDMQQSLVRSLRVVVGKPVIP